MKRSLPKKSRTDMYPILGIIAIWVVMEMLINPRGNFPLNDDWWYARIVGTLLDEHRLEYPFGVPMTLVAQVAWGALFCKLFGTSFNVLRASTLVLGLTGILVTYALLKEMGASRRLAFVGAIVVAVNPWYVQLSNNFMTDVPFFCFSLLSLFFYTRALKRGLTMDIAAGTLFALIAVFIRQVGVILPASFALAYLVKNGLRTHSSLARALLPVVLALGLLFAYQEWLSSTGRMSLYYSIQSKAGLKFLSGGVTQVLSGFLTVTKMSLMYVGLFLLPILLLTLPAKDAPSRRLWRVNLAAVGVFFLLLLASLILRGQWMPLKKQYGNVLIDFGLGPATLLDMFPLRLRHIPTAPAAFWQLVTVVAAAGAALLLWHILHAAEMAFSKRRKTDSDIRWLSVLWFSALVFSLAPIVLVSKFGYFDRYFLIFLPLFMPIAVLNGSASKGRAPIVAAVTVIALYAIFSVGATHDYFAWNRARWEAYAVLIDGGIPPRVIHGGYECNGFMCFENRPGWQKGIKPYYAITFGSLWDCKIIARFPFTRWMPPGQGEILILKWTPQR